jgi:integrase
VASLQKKGVSFYCQFLYLGKRHTFTVGPVEQDEAENKAAQVDYLLMRLKQRLIVLPDGCDIVTFVRHDGNPPNALPTLPEAKRRAVTLGHLRDRYLDAHGNGTVEANTLYTRKIHFAHMARVLGEGLAVGDIAMTTLQDYVNKRAKQVSAVTIRKELATLRAAWNWGELSGLTSGKFPNKGLRYPKLDEKPPFMTMDEIKRRIAGGAGDELWECLYLRIEEIVELLAHVKTKATLPWVYPMFCFAAHTGARRSEIIRARVEDVDFVENVATINEKKRTVGERTTRRVPLSPFLRDVLKDWQKVHPGGPHLFCQAGELARSKKRSGTTGHQREGKRSTSLKGRMATVQKRKVPAPAALSLKEVYYFFKDALKDSKWGQVRGLHTLRHSFISVCAAKGIDPRMVEAWVGHMTPAMARRYTHLRPDSQQDAIKSVFA